MQLTFQKRALDKKSKKRDLLTEEQPQTISTPRNNILLFEQNYSKNVLVFIKPEYKIIFLQFSTFERIVNFVNLRRISILYREIFRRNVEYKARFLFFN